ncbi:hypothetical protein [Saccharopolyspora hattusasensis]|uniref:hypothetical protein n=1 Tax=Saccharopolyspora hattusasensis TaxID=1128679 RepID=UPI003D96C63B
MAAVGCALVPHVAPLGLGAAVLIALVAGWGTPATNGPGLSLPSDLFGSAAAGPGVGLVLLVAGAGGIISPILAPYIASVSNWTVGWYVTADATLVGLLINLVLGSERSSQTAAERPLITAKEA